MKTVILYNRKKEEDAKYDAWLTEREAESHQRSIDMEMSEPVKVWTIQNCNYGELQSILNMIQKAH